MHPLVEGFQDVLFAVPDQVDRALDRLDCSSRS